MKIEERKKSIVCAREHTIYFFMLISEKLADFIIAVTGKCIECELRGVGTRSLLRVWSFEGVRPRLTPVPRNSDYKIIRKHSKKSTPEGSAFKKRKLCMEYSHRLTAKTDGIVSFAPFILSFPIISFSSVICLLFKKKFCIIIRAVRPYGNSELMNRVRSGRKQL